MRFGGLLAINDLSFEVGRGDITALIGPNGAGKTTVFNCVTGFYKPTEGRIVARHGKGAQVELVDYATRSGKKWHKSGEGAVYLLERMPDHEISQKAKVARTFQNIRLFSGMTVLENLLVAQHNVLMVASAYTVGGILGLASFKRAERRRSKKRSIGWSMSALSIGPTMRRAICLMGINGGWRLRAPCVWTRWCCVWTNLPRA